VVKKQESKMPWQNFSSKEK